MGRRLFLLIICFFMAIAHSDDIGGQGKPFKDAEPLPPIVVSGDVWQEIKLSNPSFEEGSNDYPSDWDRWGKGAFFWSNEDLEGRRSVGLRKTDWSTGWKSLSFPVFSDYQKQYTWYYCEAYVKTKGASGRIFISISWYGEKGWLCNSRSPYFLHPDTKAWYKMSLFALPPKGAQRGEIYLRADKETTGEVLFDSVKLYSLSLPLISPVGDDFDSPYISFIADYPTHSLLCYAYLQIAQTAEDKWEGRREKQELLSAINEYANLAKLFPFWKAWAFSKEAEICIKGEEFKKANGIGEELLKEQPQEKGIAYYILSDAYKEIGEYEKSLTYAKLAVENAKEEDWFVSRAKINHAYSLEHLMKYEEAEKEYEKLAGEHLDQRPFALLGMGNCAYSAKNFKIALEAFEKLTREYPDVAPDVIITAEWMKGECYIAMGYSWDKVIAQFQKINEEFPNSGTAGAAKMKIMQIYLFNIGDRERARKELEEIIRDYKSEYPDIIFMSLSLWGSFYLKRGEYEKAIESYKRILEVVPQFGDKALMMIGECYKISGKLDEALESFQQVLSKYPSSELCPEALLFKGVCLYQKGRKGEALKVFQEVVSRYEQRAGWQGEELD